MRRPRERPGADRILAAVGAARDVPGGTRYDLEIADDDERVPAVLLMPRASQPVPAALLLHGSGSRKERMAHTVGDALLRRGVAALAADLPMHGARARAGVELTSSNPGQLFATWRAAVREARLSMEFLLAHAQVDATRVGLVGYSLGSFLANVVASQLPSARAVVLAASGDLPPGLPFESVVRTVVDPLRAVRRIAGRPLLMVSGRYDRTVTPAQAERLFAAAGEPKTMRWYNGGHWPPDAEIEAAAGWLSERLSEPVPVSATRTSRTRASRGA